MSDEEFNPCECMWSYLSIQHLLSILRRSQDYCTDTECFNISRIPGPQPIRESSDFLFICMIIAIIVFMYAFRPSMYFRSSGYIKNNDEPDSQNGPPSPPTVN
ncbi:hypothetical protein HN011_010210 [Eciton burchellii]|nr:hypothetical protein HN011_010210 [Eciton burchellii]